MTIETVLNQLSASLTGAQQPNRSVVTTTDLTQVYDHALPRLRRVVAGMGIQVADAADILQDVYLVAMQRAQQCQGPDHITRWLIRVTVNRCLLSMRRKGRRRRGIAALARKHSAANRPTGLPESESVRREETDAVRLALATLDVSLKVPLVLKYFCDCNATEIGRILELNSSTVRSRLREGRMILANSLIVKGLGP